MYNSNTRTPPLSGGAPSPPGMNNAMLATSGLYSFSTSTPPSVSSNAGSPQSGFLPSNDFVTGASASGGVFDVQGMEMEFGGYGVPMADKEAMLRHFAPAISQDGQIGVDRDTMMMWSTMPSTLECVSTHPSICISLFYFEAHVGARTQDWETYLSSMLGIGATNDGAGHTNIVTGVNAGVVDGMGRFL